MSSSESSDDDEETRKICQAVIPDDFLASITSQPTAAPAPSQNIVHSNEVKERPGKSTDVPLKSNRSDKTEEKDDQRHGYFLKTTPEFRAYIERHLTQALDKQIDADLKARAWEKDLIINNSNEEKGIKLFSDDKKLCLGDFLKESNNDSHCPKKPPKIRAKKHKLRSSSESSEDEDKKINSCVFTVDSIKHENKMLEDLSACGDLTQGQEKNDKGGQPCSNGHHPSLSGGKKIKTSSTKSKQGCVDLDLENSRDCDTELKAKRKKKKGKKQKKTVSEEEVEAS